MSGPARKQLVIVAVVFLFAVIGLSRRPAPTYAVRVAHYDPGAHSAGVVISNRTGSDMTYACWLKDSNARETDGTIEPHEALQIALLLPDGETEIYIEGTPEPGRFRSFLSRFGIEFAVNLPVFVNLTNGSEWVLPTR